MKSRIQIFLAVLLIASDFCGGAELLVPGGYKSIQAAVDAAFDGDVVIVADGTFRGEGNRDIDFGGKIITVRSENGPENCIIDCQGSEAEEHRGFDLKSGEGEGTVIEGFTITNGYAARHGGGLCFSSRCSPTVINCKIVKNFSSLGAAVACYNASLTITDCIISENTSSFRGGGMACGGASVVTTGCTISNNSAKAEGGGIYCWGESSLTISKSDITGNSAGRGGGVKTNSQLTMEDCVVMRNSASQGGGLYCSEGASGKIKIANSNIIANSGAQGAGLYCSSCYLEISDCDIIGNLAHGDGGGIHSTCHLTITRCTISGNSSVNGSGGAMWCYGSPPIVIHNSIISGNTAGSGGCAIECIERCLLTIINSTISHNSAVRGGAVNCTQSSSATITNCILWANRPTQLQLSSLGSNSAVVTCTDIQGGWKGDGNIDADPLFIMDAPDSKSGALTDNPSYDPSTNRTTLTDANAEFGEGELAGSLIQVNSSRAKQALITANSATTLEVIGDLRTDAAKGDKYRFVDYYLQPGSPCIDAGTAEGAPETDIEGNRRRVKPDIGAYEAIY